MWENYYVKSLLDEISGLIIFYDDEDEIVKDGLRIEVVPAWKWMLVN